MVFGLPSSVGNLAQGFNFIQEGSLGDEMIWDLNRQVWCLALFMFVPRVLNAEDRQLGLQRHWRYLVRPYIMTGLTGLAFKRINDTLVNAYLSSLNYR